MSEKASRTFEVTVESPHGSQAVDQFRHWLGKVSDEARERWGIDIQIKELQSEPDHTEGFE
jgi:hypothetical protein